MDASKLQPGDLILVKSRGRFWRDRQHRQAALALSLARAAPPRFAAFHALGDLPLDWTSPHCGTTNDFLVISERRPDLLSRVE